jgi:hypothetical protein
MTWDAGFIAPIFLGSAGVQFFASTSSGSSTAKQATSADGITWLSAGSSNAIQSTTNTGLITLEENRWVLGNGSVAEVDKDGVNGIVTPSTNLNLSYDMCFGNGKYVAVGSTAGGANPPMGIAYATSLNGSYTNVAITGTGVAGSAINYVNGLYIAITGSGTISTSPDAVTWTVRYNPSWASNPDRNYLVYGNNHYIALVQGSSASAGCTYLYSADAVTWTEKDIAGFNDIGSGDDTQNAFGAIIYWNGLWYGFSNTKYAYTTTPNNAASWTVGTTTFGSVTTVRGVVANQQRMVVFGLGASSTPAISYGTDGINWTAASVSSALGTSPAQTGAVVGSAG